MRKVRVRKKPLMTAALKKTIANDPRPADLVMREYGIGQKEFLGYKRTHYVFPGAPYRTLSLAEAIAEMRLRRSAGEGSDPRRQLPRRWFLRK